MRSTLFFVSISILLVEPFTPGFLPLAADNACIRCQTSLHARTKTHPDDTSSSSSKTKKLSSSSSKVKRKKSAAKRKPPKRFDEYIVKLEDFKSKHGHTRVDRNEEPELQEWIKSVRNTYRYQYLNQTDILSNGKRRQRLPQEKMERLHRVGFIWYERKKKKKFDDYILKLEEYKLKHGHINVDRKEEPELAEWMQSIRNSYRRQHLNQTSVYSTGKIRAGLAPEKMERLNRLDFPWHEYSKFDDCIQKLEDYISKYGHAVVDRKEDPELAKWILNVRTNYRYQHFNRSGVFSNGRKRARLALEKMERLNRVGFPWYERSQKRDFDAFFKRLELYKRDHGDCLVDPSIDPDLADWVETIKVKFRHQHLKQDPNGRSQLAADKMARLDRIGFSWETKTERRWNERYEKLRAVFKSTGTCFLPRDHALGIWTRQQATAYPRYLEGNRNSTLTDERVSKLADLNFWETYKQYRYGLSHDDQWEMRFQELQDFHTMHGHTNVPQYYEKNAQLAFWVMNQRKNFKCYAAGLPTCLTAERIKRLEDLSFRWNAYSYIWSTKVEQLRRFVEDGGDIHNATDPGLRMFLMNQRLTYHYFKADKHSPMTEWRIAELESIPNFTWRHKSRMNPRVDRGPKAPSAKDWAQLFDGLEELGFSANAPSKEHMFEGEVFAPEDIKERYTDDDFMDLWNQEDD